MNKLLTYILTSVIVILALSQPVFATNTETNETHIHSNKIAAETSTQKPQVIPKPKFLPGPDKTEQDAAEGGARGTLVDKILPFFGVGMVGFTGGVSLLFLIISGVRFVTSYGNEEDIKKAKDQAMYAIIGFIISLLAYAVVTIIINLEIS